MAFLLFLNFFNPSLINIQKNPQNLENCIIKSIYQSITINPVFNFNLSYKTEILLLAIQYTTAMKQHFKTAFLSILSFSSTIILLAQPGSPDLSFGNNGTLKDLTRQSYEKAIVCLANKHILIGSSGFYNGYNTFLVDCLLPNGKKDSSFGVNGTAFIQFSQFMFSFSASAQINSLAVLPNGRIIAAGYGTASGINGNIALAALNSNGTPDTTFGKKGTLLTGFDGNETVNAIALQADGKIVVGGRATQPFSQDGSHFFVARFLPDGSKDASFGNGGILLSNSIGSVNTIVIQKDKKIVAGGYNNSQTGVNFHLERYISNGSYDKSFGSEGIISSSVNDGSLSYINDVILQKDQKIVVAGRTIFNGLQTFTVARYNTNGGFDNSFGNKGIVTTEFPQKIGNAVEVLITGEKENKIVVAGSNYANPYGGTIVVAAYNNNGDLDTTFGTGGITMTKLEGSDFINASSLQPDGRIVVLGNDQTPFYPASRALASYNGYPQKKSLFVIAKRWLQNHNISWNGLPASDNIAYYIVEQSKNGVTGFTQIAKISGTNHQTDYSTINSHLLQGANYYRIKAVSNGGAITYSEVVSVDNFISLFTLYPNPAKDYISVYGLPVGKMVNLSFCDAAGNVLAKGVSNGNNQYRFQITNTKPGTYYIGITADGKTNKMMFLKQ